MTGRAIIIRAVTIAAVLSSAWWAFRPLEQPDLSFPQPPGAKPEGSSAPMTLVALDDSAFRAPLWVAPPPPPVPPPEVKPVQLPPLRLQLLAIVRQSTPEVNESTTSHSGDQFTALLYDPDTDKLLEVAEGQAIGDRTVVGITQREITLKDRTGTRTLSLRDDTRPASNAGGGS